MNMIYQKQQVRTTQRYRGFHANINKFRKEYMLPKFKGWRPVLDMTVSAECYRVEECY